MIALIISAWNFMLAAQERRVADMIRTGRIPRYF
jgi:hypothetical protein